MVMDKDDVAALLAIYLIQQSPKATASRQRALRHLLELAIFEADGAIPESELGDRVAHVAALDTPLPYELLDRAVDEELELGRINRDNGNLVLGRERVQVITAAQEQYLGDAQHFDDHLMRCVTSELGSEPHDVAKPMIPQAVAKVIIESARRCLPDAPNQMSLEMDDLTAGAGLFDAPRHLAGELKPIADNFEHGQLDVLVRGVRRFFGELDEPCTRHVTSLYHKVFCHQLLNLDPHLHEPQQQALEATRLYLDTNIAVDYLLNHDRMSPASIDVIEACRALGVQLFISPMTKSELIHLKESAASHRQLAEDDRVQRVLDARPGGASNPFILAYLKRRRSNPRLTWSGFVKPFEDIEQFLLGRDIVVEDEAVDALSEHPHYGRVWQALRAIKPDYQSDRAVDHDTENCLLVHELRKTHEPNILFGPSTWLVTRDRTLAALDHRLGSTFEQPHSKQLTDWAEALLRFQNIGRFVARDYIAHILQARLGILPPSDGVDIAFLSLLQQAEEFDLDEILALEPEHAAQVLIAMQMDREAVKLAERAASASDATERKEAGARLAGRTLEAMAEERERAVKAANEAESRLMSVESALGAVQQESHHTRILVQDLHRKVSKYQSASLLQRIVWLFRKPR